MASLKRLTSHHCDLHMGSDSCLPTLRPQSSKAKKLIREWRKLFMVSSNNSNTVELLKSKAAIIQERKRQIKISACYTIHPFSTFCIYQEYIMSIMWIISYFKDPYIVTFTMDLDHTSLNFFFILNFIVELIIALNILLCVITGYYKSETKEAVIIPSQIVKHYLKTYFIIDLNSTIPYPCILMSFANFPHTSAVVTYASFLSLLRIARFKTMLKYFRRITLPLHISDTVHDILSLILIFVYLLHWLSCTIYLIPYIRYKIYNYIPDNSWVVKAGVEPYANVTYIQRYIQCVYCAVTHFYRAGTDMYMSDVPYEQAMFSIVIVLGTLFSSYLIVNILNLFQSLDSAGTRYDDMLHQLMQYADSNKLSLVLRKRLFLYYEKRYKRHFFKEQNILLTVSEHLRYELYLHNRRELLEKVEIFRGLPKSCIGSIIGKLKEEIFLSNDVIAKADTPSKYVYFISHGTVVMLTTEGNEVLYLEDGDYFGELSIVASDLNGKYLFHVVAVEETELYLLPDSNFTEYFTNNEQTIDLINQQAICKLETIRSRQRMTLEEETKHKDILFQLRKGRILHHGHRSRT